jgi:gamma-glutamyltranspeptidase/glutathione hydrolase
VSGLDWRFPYPSQRMPVLAGDVVATSQPLAAQAGLRMLLAGGNAVDAALGAAITATVVEPVANGIGADAFAIIWDGQRLHGLNASGRSPASWSVQRFAPAAAMPATGWDAVTVPGAVSAWTALSQRFGKLPFESLFEPAIEYAEHGFLVSPTVARQWAAQAGSLGNIPGFAAAFLPRGRAPEAGEHFKFPAQAATLRAIADTKGEAFYRGELAARMVTDARRHQGALTREDLAAHQPVWVEPLEQRYRQYSVHELPPNGQGLAALIALAILQHFDLQKLGLDSADSVHVQIEATKLAFADVYAHVADPAAMRLGHGELLDPAYIKRRADLIDMNAAHWPGTGTPRDEGTVYITAADRSGMMVSFIQSNYRGFGSGVVVPETGISLNNRGSGFSLVPGHPNVVAGAKLPFHTIIPGFVTRGGKPVMSFGVMGANMQPQGHVQMMVRFADYGQNIQAAADAPRWKITEDQARVMVEPGFASEVLATLAARGHRLELAARDSIDFGATQLIQRLDYGYLAASERRRDGQALGF